LQFDHDHCDRVPVIPPNAGTSAEQRPLLREEIPGQARHDRNQARTPGRVHVPAAPTRHPGESRDLRRKAAVLPRRDPGPSPTTTSAVRPRPRRPRPRHPGARRDLRL